MDKFNAISGETDTPVDLVSAKKIKKMGFHEPTHYYWLDKDLPFCEKGLKRVKVGSNRMDHNKYDDFIYSAPTLSELYKWTKKLLL